MTSTKTAMTITRGDSSRRRPRAGVSQMAAAAHVRSGPQLGPCLRPSRMTRVAAGAALGRTESSLAGRPAGPKTDPPKSSKIGRPTGGSLLVWLLIALANCQPTASGETALASHRPSQEAHTHRVSARHLLLQQQQQLAGSRRDKQIIQRASLPPNGQLNPDAPKLIPLSALDHYQEGADLRLFCSASAPKSAGALQFEWRRNQNEPLLLGPELASDGDQMQTNKGGRVRISMMDESASLLRITQLEADDSGNYTCLVRNQQGFDSATVRVSVTVKLKWILEPPSEVRARAGKSLQLECDASGQPAPTISWTSLKDRQTINSKVLRIERVSVNDSGLYECRAAASGPHQSGRRDPVQSGEQLHKLVHLIVNGKY